MSLPHALLTALLEHPGSGSELARRFDRSIGHFWQATHQQIYRELGRLEQAGWVESKPASGRGRKRAYRVLPAGRAELRRWTAQAPAPVPVRVELMVRLRAEAAVGPTTLRRNIERLLQEHSEKREQYRRIEAQDFPPGAHSRQQQLQHLVLQGGIMFQTLWIEFCEQALRTLAAAQPAAKPAARRRRAGG